MALNLGAGLKRNGEEEKDRREDEELHSLNDSVVEFKVFLKVRKKFVEDERMSVSRRKRDRKVLE